ncbi:MAG: histidine phosphatase family protein [Bacilli bacterium]|nr:histidine phosphatase family protein [Bacilli bacterium]
MKTYVYISRHSEPFRKLLGEYDAEEVEQIRNEKNILSVNGEKKAQKLSEHDELQNIDYICSSHYVRAMSTAKYIAERNNIKLNVDSRFGERKFGVDNMNDLTKDFFIKQAKDWDYKLENGESLNEVTERMIEAFNDVLKNNMGKKIVIVAHGTSLTAMLSRLCEVKVNEEKEVFEVYFNNNLIFTGGWSAPELFKLEFDDYKLTNIKNIEL